MSNNTIMSKKYWSQQETEVLVNQFILRKVSVDYWFFLMLFNKNISFLIRKFSSVPLPLSKPNDGHGRKYMKPFSLSAHLINRRIWLNCGRNGTTFLLTPKKPFHYTILHLKEILILIKDWRNEGVMYDYDLQMVYLLMFWNLCTWKLWSKFLT